MKMSKDEMRNVLGGGIEGAQCMTMCWDGSKVHIDCDWSNCTIYNGDFVMCGMKRSVSCPPKSS